MRIETKKDILRDLGVKKELGLFLHVMPGSRIKIDGGEVRLLNDDEVLATVENPEDIFHDYLIIGRNYARRQRKNR